MLSVPLARRLRDAGLVWDPRPGDWFVVDKPEMLGTPFVVSDMTVQVHDLPQGTVIGFNGTTEWALDSVQRDEALWLPAEGQLRHLLGTAFLALERGVTEHRVVTEHGVFPAADPAEAYGEALLRQLTLTRRTG